MVAEIPGARLILAGGGHALPLENPHAIARELEAPDA
jgi:pimeloyl-ACP methyl ester carboxylesterase